MKVFKREFILLASQCSKYQDIAVFSNFLLHEPDLNMDKIGFRTFALGLLPPGLLPPEN